MKLALVAVLFSTARAKFTANDERATQEMKGSGTTSKDVCEGRSSACSVLLDVPSACAGDTSACPVVIQFHGHGGRAEGAAMMGSPSVHTYNFIGIAPQGETYDVSGWNDGSMKNLKCKWNDFDCTEDPNDGLFVAGLIAAMKELGATGRFYLYGGSNGANEAQILAANACDELPIAGIGVDSGQLLATPNRSAAKPYDYNQPCAGSQPCTGGRKVAQISIHGDADGAIPYAGGSRFGSDVFTMMPELDSDKLWATQNGCTGSIAESSVSAVASQATTTATHYVWGGCPAEAPVEHYKVAGGGHVATRSLDGKTVADTVFRFFVTVEKAHEAKTAALVV